MGDLDKNPHVKPDWENVEFALFMGTSPAQSGNPFKRQASQLASARTREDFNYVVVSPALPLTTVLADDHGHWLAIKPGSDSALAMAMIQWIIDNERFMEDYLTITCREAMLRVGEKSWTNATAGHRRRKPSAVRAAPYAIYVKWCKHCSGRGAGFK